MSMKINGTEFYNSMILQSKLNSTSITRTHFCDFRFYNNIFLRTNFDLSFIATTLFENSTMKSVLCFRMSLISMDFRNSWFNILNFEEDVDIQKSNFSNCVLVDSHIKSPHIIDTIFDDSHFTSVNYTDNSQIINCSFNNVVYVNTNIIATSVTVQIEWPTIVLHMPGSVISTLPQTVSQRRTRDYPLISRLFLGTEGGVSSSRDLK